MLTKIVGCASCTFVIVEVLRIGLFVASGWGLLPLGFATAFSTASVLLSPTAFGFVAAWRRWVAVEKARDLLLLAIVAGSLVFGAFVLNSTVLRGVHFFRRGFDACVRSQLSSGALLAWAEAKLQTTEGLQDEQNIRLKQEEIPLALRQLRKWSEPTAVLVFASKEKRWVFLRVKWREAFLEWGVMFTDKTDGQFDREAQLRKLEAGAYAFYE